MKFSFKKQHPFKSYHVIAWAWRQKDYQSDLYSHHKKYGTSNDLLFSYSCIKSKV